MGTLRAVAGGGGGGTPAFPVTITGGVSGGIPYFDSTTSESASALLAQNGIVLGGGASTAPSTSAALTFTPSTAILAVAAVTGSGPASTDWLIKNSTSNSGVGSTQSGVAGCVSLISNNLVCASFFGNTNGTLPGTMAFGFASGAPNSATSDASLSRGGASNSIVFSASTAGAGAVTSRAEINKAVTGIADATPTATFTVTVPNAAHSASIRVRVTGSLGAGGAIGANESTQDAEYHINVARTAGVNAVATIGAVTTQAAAASVAGANNAAVTGTLSAVSGAVGATNTFTVNVTITKSGGASASHTCFAFAELLNANATGVTIA